MTLRRQFKLTADADLRNGYVAELESINGVGGAFVTLVFYDEQQHELRELLEANGGEVTLYLGAVPKAVAKAEVLRPND